MRELQPWVDESAVAETFEDIAELALGCRFSNCAHQTEPGCAVLAAVVEGRLDPERLEHFRHLGKEIAFEERKRDKSSAAAQKKKWKKVHQATSSCTKSATGDKVVWSSFKPDKFVIPVNAADGIRLPAAGGTFALYFQFAIDSHISAYLSLIRGCAPASIAEYVTNRDSQAVPTAPTVLNEFLQICSSMVGVLRLRWFA